MSLNAKGTGDGGSREEMVRLAKMRRPRIKNAQERLDVLVLVFFLD